MVWILLCVTLLAFIGIGRVRAQDPGNVSLTARAGFDGYCKEGNWIPVKVTVENSGADLNARILVTSRSSMAGRSIYAADLPLPGSSRKELFLYVYPQNFLSALNVNVIADGRELVKTELRVTCLTGQNLLFGLLADNPSAYLVLNDIQVVGGFVRVAQLEIADLPDRVQGWDALDALVVSGVDTGTLTAGQKQALASWLAGGGKLFVVGGPKWQATTSGLEEFLPIDLNATKVVGGFSELQAYAGDPLPLDGEAVVAVGKVDSGADIPVVQDGVPLIVQSDVGYGRVIYFAADPGLQPLSGWEGIKAVYNRLLASDAPMPIWANLRWDTYYANNALATLSELAIPSTLFVCFWLTFYVIVIGPVNYLVLNRIKRRELAWLSIPILVVIFTSLAYFSGFFYRGARPILNRLVVVQASDNSGQARVDALVGLYSPSRAKHTVEADSSFMFHPFVGGDGTLQTDNNWFVLQQGSKMSVPDVRVEIGGMQAVAAQGTIPAIAFEHDLVVNVGAQAPTLTGTITNTSAYVLRSAFLVTSGDWKRLGDIPPGGVKDINIRLTSGSNGPKFYNLNASDILGMDYYSSDLDEKDRRRRELMDAVFSSGYAVKEANWGFYLMGWIEEPLASIGLQDKKFDAIDTTLYILKLSPENKVENGQLLLTPSMFIWESSVAGNSPYSNNGIPAGGYTLDFKPAVPIRFSAVKSLTLNISSTAMPGDVYVFLWDFERGDWDQIGSFIWGENDIPDPSRYVSPAGGIRLRIDGNQNQWIQLSASNFTLVVEP